MISLRSTPFDFDFAGNKPRFSVRAQPFVTHGVKDSWTFAICQIPYVSGFVNTLNLTTPYATIVRTIHPSNTWSNHPDYIRSENSSELIRDLLLDKLCNSASITDHYVVNVWCGFVNGAECCFLKLTERYCTEQHTISLEYKQGATPVSVIGDKPVVSFQEHIAGRAENKRQNYSVIGRFLVTRTADLRGEYPVANEEETELLESPSFRLQCNGDRADIDTSMLLSYFNGMDIPKTSETTAANIVRHNIIRYRLQYAESYDSQAAIYYRTSKEFFLLNATIDRHSFLENAPDWDTIHTGQVSEATMLINWGCDTKAIRKTFLGCENYFHIANFTSSSRNATVRFVTGATTTNTTVAIPALSIVRIPVQINDSGVFQRRVQILDGVNVIIDHLFEIVEKPYNAHVLLLQNHVGLPETLYVDNITVDRNVQNDEVVLNDELLPDLSSKGTSLTVRTGYKTKNEMNLLGDALHNADNYLLAGDLAYRISFTESAITIIDESDDLQSAEFTVSLGKPVSRKIKLIDDSTEMVEDTLIDNTTFYHELI